MSKFTPRRVDDGLPQFQNDKWKRVMGNVKFGYCDGRNISSLKCKLYASLRPVYYRGKTIYLCGKCEAKLKKIKPRGVRPIPRY